MVCFDVYLNGRKLCRAGVGASGVLSAMVTWASRASDGPAEPFLAVGGLYRSEPHEDQSHPQWVEHQRLATGDEVILRVVHSEVADAPVAVDRTTAEDVERHQRAYYEQLKARFDAG